MFALPGILFLLLAVLVRPFEFIPALRDFKILYIAMAIALAGVVVDIKLGYLKLRTTPATYWLLAYAAWCVATAAAKAPWAVVQLTIELAISVAIYLVITHAVQSFKALETVAIALLAATMFIATVSVHMGTAEFGCVAVPPDGGHTAAGTPDGRSCTEVTECRIDPPEPSMLYRCEKVGMFGLSSISEGRVRYLGTLHDPNELALAVSMSVPLAGGLYQRKKSKTRLSVLLLTILLAAMTVIYSQSRGGLLVFLATAGVYLLKRFKWTGVIVGGVLAAPMMLLGGRGGKAAEGSTLERLECWQAGIMMFQSSPAIGVGYGQYTQHHFLTAHNSYVLAFAETGAIGVTLWTTAMYMTTKIVLAGATGLEGEAAEIARIWGLALLSAFVGMLTGILLLSFAYHPVLWIYCALVGAYYVSVKRHAPDWKVELTARDLAYLVAINAVLFIGIFVYVKLKVG